MNVLREALIAIPFLILLYFVFPTSSAVIGIDIGIDAFKVALVKPGTQFHIVLDEQSKRKHPQVVVFDDDERLFGNNGINLAIRKPEKTFLYASQLLGKTIDSPEVEWFKRQYLPYEIVSTDRNVVAFRFKHEGEILTFTAEELVAMSLEHIRILCEEDAGVPIKDAVIAVPEFWTQKERQALLDAADVAGLNVLTLINENTAAAIQYGIDRDYSPDSTHRVIIYNMGAASTKVSLAEYSGYLTKDLKKKNKTIGQFEIRATAWDDTLGGIEFDNRIVDYLADRLQQDLAKKGFIDVNVRTQSKTMAKLRKKAQEVKKILSANADTPVYIEGAYKDFDFRGQLTRDKFIEITRDLLDRAVAPLQAVLQESQLTVQDINSVQIIGGGVRVPAIQAKLKAFLGKDPDQNLNCDESVAMGAVIRGANLSTAFQMRPFGFSDLLAYPVGVRIREFGEEVNKDEVEDTTEGDGEANPIASKVFAKRVALFKRNNKLSKRKTVTFNSTTDLQVSLHYDSPSLLPKGVSPAIGIYNVTGIVDLIANQSELFTNQQPRINLAFSLTYSGTVHLSRVEATAEETIQVRVKKAKAKKSESTTTESETKDKEASGKTEGEGSEPGDGEKNDNNKDKESDGESKENEPESKGEENKEAHADGSSSKTKENDTKEDAKEDEEEAEEEVKFESQVVTRKFPLKINFGGAPGGPLPLNEQQLRFSKSILKKLKKKDDIKMETAKAKNDLEQYIYSTRNQLEEEEVTTVSTEDQRNELVTALSEAESWLNDIAPEDEASGIFKDKLTSVRKLADPIFIRRLELNGRPVAIEQALILIGHARDLIGNLTKQKPWIPAEDKEKLMNMTLEVEAWMNAKIAEQEDKNLWEDPAFSSRELLAKLEPIAKYSTQLIKRQKPKEAAKPKKKPANKTSSEGASGSSESTTDSGESKEKGSEQSEQKESSETENKDKENEKIPDKDADINEKDGEGEEKQEPLHDDL